MLVLYFSDAFIQRDHEFLYLRTFGGEIFIDKLFPPLRWGCGTFVDGSLKPTVTDHDVIYLLK